MTDLGNLQQGEFLPQAGFTAAQDENGQWTAVHKFACFSNQVLALTPRKGDPCTKDGYSALTFTSSQSTDIVGSPWSYVNCTYKGTIFTGDGSDPGDDEEDILPTYNTSVVVTSEPIESHEKFESFTGTEWAEVKDYKDGRIIIDPEDSAAYKKQKYEDGVYKGFTEDFTPTALQIELFEALDSGFTSFYSPRITHTRSYTSNKQISDTVWSNVGKIDDPGDAAPVLPGLANYLFMGATSDNSGDVFNLEMEWLGSGATGWKEGYYD